MKTDRVVYAIRNVENGKEYVGISKFGVDRRWRTHVKNATVENTPFHKAILKYGPRAFSVRVIEHCSTDNELKALEVFWIEKLDTYRHGYNATLGGDGGHGYKFSAETVARRAAKIRVILAKPSVRRKQAKAIKEALQRPEVVLHKKALWQKPEYRRRALTGILAYTARRKRKLSLEVRLCECGCKAPVPLATRTREGNTKGQPLRFVKGHARRGKTYPSLRISSVLPARVTPNFVVL